ncbi:MAG TPA: aminopeptidase [Spirochaetia bacterium]|nr:aminopeptidase [Spirochaetia bacterium]
MHEEYYDKLADLLLFAVGFRGGDKIALTADSYYRGLAKRLAERAYLGGACYVDLEYSDEFLQAAAIAGSEQEFSFPEYLQRKYEEITQPGWKLISIRANSEGDVFGALPVDRSTAFLQAHRHIRRVRTKAVMTHKIPWTLTYLPSPSMANLAFPGLSEEAGMERYWDAIVKIMYLDDADPRERWRAKQLADEKRSSYMNELKAEALRFNGPGTELTVGLNSRAQWIGGFDLSLTGERFMANIPTEEIFTSPDFRRVDGRVRLTRPFRMHQNLGPIPLNAWFEFREGRVVDFGAEVGRETLAAFFESDPRAVYLGEIALVDPSSPIAATGITYFNGLHDENTSCHLAFGRAYPSTLIDRRDYSDEELLAAGMNAATVHEDSMIGGPEVDVTAILSNGGEHPIIRDGHYLI